MRFRSDGNTRSTLSTQLHTQRVLNDSAQDIGLMTNASEGQDVVIILKEPSSRCKQFFSSSLIDTNNARIVGMEKIS